MKKQIITISAIVAATLLIIAVIVFGFADLPSVVGEENFDAKARLEEAGFTYREGLRYSDTVEAGKVITQSPESGRAFKLVPVLCEISVGPNRSVVRVPQVEGGHVLDGILRLLDANLSYTLTAREDSSVPRGQIMRQNIRAEVMIQRQTKIKLEVNARDIEDILSMMGAGFALIGGEIVFAEKDASLENLKTQIEQADGRISYFQTPPVTIRGGESLSIPRNITLEYVFNEENTAIGITVEKGGTLIIDDLTLVGEGGMLEIESGSITYKPMHYGMTIAINGNASIPHGKHFTLPDEHYRYNTLFVETGILTVCGTLTHDGRDMPGSGYIETGGGAIIVAADGTVELLRGGSISDAAVFRPGAILIGDESIVYREVKMLGVEEEVTIITGIVGIAEPGTYVFDGDGWTREEEDTEVLE